VGAHELRRRLLRGLGQLGLVCAVPGLAACGGGAEAAEAAPRRWRMGLASLPPRPEVAAVLQGMALWAPRAEVAAIHEDLPWSDLLAGMSPEAILARDKVELVRLLRGQGLSLYFMADPTNGLSRADEAAALRQAGRSLAEPDVQQLYRSYVRAVARVLQPQWLGLAAETNLIRAAAPAALYGAVRQAAQAAAADLRADGYAGLLTCSVQVETAWGRLGAPGGNPAWVGIDAHWQDFGFSQVLGLSSYPYFGFAQPEDLPADYYSRLLAGGTTPVMVLEGGWSSASVGRVVSSPALQARYLRRHAQLLDSVAAQAWVQLMFADLDLAAWPTAAATPQLALFAQLGLVDSQFRPKPALAVWDELHARPWRAA
jgi:hypothetical protein